MKLINTKTHAIIDYICGALLIASPWLFNFYDKTEQTLVPLSIGALVLVYSLFTKTELSMFRALRLRAHLIIDLVLGTLLALSPWLFRFNETVYAPHLVIGLILIVSSIATTVLSVGKGNIRIPKHPKSHEHLHSTAWMGHTE